MNPFHTHTHTKNSCCCVKRLPKNWRKNKNVKQLNVDVSLKNGAENQRTLKTQMKVFLTLSKSVEKSISLWTYFTPFNILFCYDFNYISNLLFKIIIIIFTIIPPPTHFTFFIFIILRKIIYQHTTRFLPLK